MATSNNGFKVISFQMSTGGNCMGEGLYSEVHCNSNEITDMGALLLKRSAPGQKFFLDHVHAIIDTCVSLPHKAFVAGHPGAVKVKLSEMLKSGRLAINVDGYEITSFALSFCGPRIAGYVEVVNTGADFSKELKETMARMVAGQRFAFGSIQVKDRNGKNFCLDTQIMSIQEE